MQALNKAQKSLIPWMGGKFKLRKQVIESFFPHQTYVEGFFGGGAILFNKPLSKSEVINDLNGDLINLYRIVKWHKAALIEELTDTFASREFFTMYAQQKGLTDIQKAARFYYLIKTSFGGKVIDQNYGYSLSRPKFNPETLSEVIRQVSSRLARVNIENTDWQDLIKRYDSAGTLFYLDPPYYETAGYGVAFGEEQYQKMNALMLSSKGKFCVSLNDCKFVRESFAKHNFKELSINYSLAKGKNEKTSKEVIITNY